MSAQIKEPSVLVHLTVPVSWLPQMDALARNGGKQRATWLKGLIEPELRKAQQVAQRPAEETR